MSMPGFCADRSLVRQRGAYGSASLRFQAGETATVVLPAQTTRLSASCYAATEVRKMAMPAFSAEMSLYTSPWSYCTANPGGATVVESALLYPADVGCDATALAQCLRQADQDYGSCVGDCVAGNAACRSACAAVFSRDKQDCNNQFGCPPGTACSADIGGGSQAVCCAAGESNCGGLCKKLITDNSNCGRCGNVCNPGYVCCGGKCVDFQTDNANCGGCGNICPTPANSSALCTNGACDFVCAPGYSRCGNTCCLWGVRTTECPPSGKAGYRRHSAVLYNIPAGQDWMSTCQNTPGPWEVGFRVPNFCEIEYVAGIAANVWGNWDDYVGLQGECCVQMSYPCTKCTTYTTPNDCMGACGGSNSCTLGIGGTYQCCIQTTCTAQCCQETCQPPAPQ